ncbi:PREDICTED: NACHT, LRR and PYD domains-containing protein 3-like, partial [Poecilia mexicana]|uniref:NACHT, LRR and PYD domains-containing protein 3-like n=1 Tax=Poecilia mexicana TaxID=48701 RepID=UPI00072E3C82
MLPKFPGTSNNVRTVLMKGNPGVGKTFQTKIFMIDWARGNSNKHINALVTFDFKELNTKKDEEQSMESLLDDFFRKKNVAVSKDDKNKICFILDGLEKCRLPLDFVNNKEVKDLKEAASMDVLLTNLIKGNLLPDAHIWIISQPQGVKKIPSEYIKKTVQCQETNEKKLESCLKNRFLKEIADEKDEISHPNQTTTEHIIRRENGSEEEESKQNKFTKVESTSEIFKDGKGKKTRTVMTIGEAGVGKSFHMRKFIKEWAEKVNTSSFFSWIKAKVSSQAKTVELLFPLDFSKLNLIKTEISLFELLNHFFEETKDFSISDYSQLNILFLLDGLDGYHHCLDFENNKILTDVRESTSVDVLLTNLIKGNLLPKAKVWITSQPPAAEKILDGIIDRLTEIR